MNLSENERIEDLQCNGLKIIQNKQLYTFTSDSVVLANFIQTKHSDVGLEIGTGCGVISILLSAKTKFKKIYAFEIQPEMAKLAEKNIDLNGLNDKIDLICDDIENFKKYIPAGSVDFIFSNPPFMLSNGSNQNDIKNIARHDIKLPIEKLCNLSSKILKDGGHLFLVYTASRSCELIYNLIKFSLQPKRMFYTQNGKGEVKLIVIEAVKGGNSGVKVLPELTTNDKNGEYLEKLHTKYIKNHE